MNRRKAKQIGCCVSSAMLIARAFACSLAVQAEELKYAGTTQIAADSYYLDADTFAVELEVEEVYAEAGSQLAQGDQILKLTEDSYNKAIDYYTAAILRAEGNLTDVQLEYDQGVLESKYTYETAQAKAEAAETVKQYQEEELKDTISAHEEILEEIDTRIAELEVWTGTSGSSASSGSGASSGSQQSKGDSGEESESSGMKDQEKETENTDQKFSEKESESEGQPSSESETEALTEASDTQPETQPGSGETETGPGESQTEPGAGETDLGESQTKPGEPQTEPVTGEDDTKDRQQVIETLKSRLEEKKQEYSEILKQLEALGISLPVQEEETQTTQTEGDSTSEPEEESSNPTLQDSIKGNQNVKDNLENVQKNLEDVPQSVMAVVEMAYPDYEDYIKLLDECVQQLKADIQTQEAVKQALENEGSQSNSDMDMKELQTLLSDLVKIGEEKSELYSQLISEQEEWQKESQENTQPSESESQSEQNLPSGTGPQGQGTEQSEFEQTDKNSLPSGNGQNPDSGSLPTDDSSASNPSSGTGKSFSGMSSGSGGNSGGASGGISGGSLQTDSSSLQSAGGMNLSEADISLFGNEYDLTQVENLLEREPSDSDGAQELAEQLADSKKTVESQYEELLREQKITELGIQYTYDTSVIAGKLAEFTCQEEMQEWNQTLAEAKEEKEDLEAQKAFLDSMTDGILTADRTGIVSEVFYESGDTISGSTPVISYYNMDAVTISIEVPQEEIALLQVGDTVDVTINGMWNREGAVAGKAPEPQSGTSRTTVNYEVIIEIDNSDELLTSGLSASVTAVVEELSAETEEDQEGEDE